MMSSTMTGEQCENETKVSTKYLLLITTVFDCSQLNLICYNFNNFNNLFCFSHGVWYGSQILKNIV